MPECEIVADFKHRSANRIKRLTLIFIYAGAGSSWRFNTRMSNQLSFSVDCYKKECDSTSKAEAFAAGFEYTSNLSCFHVYPDSMQDPGSPFAYDGLRKTLNASELTTLSPDFVPIELTSGFVKV